jgi:hypothetical protein
MVFLGPDAHGLGNVVEQGPCLHQSKVKVLSTAVQLAGDKQSHICYQLAVPHNMGQHLVSPDQLKTFLPGGYQRCPLLFVPLMFLSKPSKKHLHESMSILSEASAFFCEHAVFDLGEL